MNVATEYIINAELLHINLSSGFAISSSLWPLAQTVQDVAVWGYSDHDNTYQQIFW